MKQFPVKFFLFFFSIIFSCLGFTQNNPGDYLKLIAAKSMVDTLVIDANKQRSILYQESDPNEAIRYVTAALLLLVYNTNAALLAGKGYYYRNGTLWNKLFIATDIAASAGWNLTANTGAIGANFLGNQQ